MKKGAFISVLILLVFCLISSVYSEGVAEKAAAYDKYAEQIAYMEKYNNSAAAKMVTSNINLGALVGTTRPSVAGRNLVGAGSVPAATAGYNIIVQGGNAFDAAVAVAGVLGLTEPMATNFLGGDAEIIVYSAKDDKVTVYNGTGWSSENATIDFYMELGGIPKTGLYSIEVPGAWAGWMTMLEDYGTMPLSEILQPVIQTAEGTLLDSALGRSVVTLFPRFKEGGNEEYVSLYTKEDGSSYSFGEVLSNPKYAEVLRNLASAADSATSVKDGYIAANDYFYRGPIAEDIVAYSDAHNGLFTIADFNEYYAERQDPWGTTYKGYEILVCPPNSQGPVLLEALNMVENFDLSQYKHNSAEYIDLLVQILNLSLMDRNMNVADPRFVEFDKNIISKEYAKERIKELTLGTPMEEIPEGQTWISFNEKGGDTTFMYVCDSEGNVVVSTNSLCDAFGSRIAIDGIVFNSRMDYFDLDTDYPNHLEPRKRTAQTITPSIALKDGKPAFIVGTPGADLQEQAKLQVILNVLDFGVLDPQKAIEMDRFTTESPKGLMYSLETPKTIGLDKGGYDPNELMKLEDMGYKLTSASGGVGRMGFAWILDNGFKWGAEDPRGTGYVIGW